MKSKNAILGGVLFALVIILIGLWLERSELPVQKTPLEVVYIPIGLGVLILGYIVRTLKPIIITRSLVIGLIVLMVFLATVINEQNVSKISSLLRSTFNSVTEIMSGEPPMYSSIDECMQSRHGTLDIDKQVCMIYFIGYSYLQLPGFNTGIRGTIPFPQISPTPCNLKDASGNEWTQACAEVNTASRNVVRAMWARSSDWKRQACADKAHNLGDLMSCLLGFGLVY